MNILLDHKSILRRINVQLPRIQGSEFLGKEVMPRPITLVQPSVSVSEFIPRATLSGRFTDFRCDGRAAVIVDCDLGVLSADYEKIFVDEDLECGLEGIFGFPHAGVVDGHVESGF